MKSLASAILLLSLFAIGTTPLPGQDPKPAPAIVTLTATVTGMSRVDEKKMELRLETKGSLLQAPQVLVDENKIKVNPFAKKPIAIQGQLTIKEVVVGMTNSIPPGKITAKALYLIAAQGTEITDNNKAKFPAPGTARVQGKIMAGNFAAGKTAKALHAIANGDQPILLLGKDGALLQNVPASGTVTAAGRLRIADNGALVLDVETIEKAGEEK